MVWLRPGELVCLTLLSACASRAPVTPTTPAPTTTPAPVSTAPSVSESPTSSRNEAAKAYSCTVAVEALGAKYEGRAEGSGTSTEPYREKAEVEACRKMLDGTHVDCANSDGYLRTVMSSVQLTNGVGSVKVIVALTPVVSVMKGTASSDLGGREACLAAVESACKAAPPGSECTSKHVACEQDQTGKVWSCEAQRRRLDAEPLVPSAPFP